MSTFLWWLWSKTKNSYLLPTSVLIALEMMASFSGFSVKTIHLINLNLTVLWFAVMGIYIRLHTANTLRIVQPFSILSAILVEMKTRLNNYDACTLMFAEKQPYTLASQVARHKQALLKSRATLLWFYFGCLSANVYKDLHFHFINVLKVKVTGMQSWVSITSIAPLHFSFLSSLPLRRNKQWLAGIWSPGSVMEWMTGNNRYKTNAAE